MGWGGVLEDNVVGSQISLLGREDPLHISPCNSYPKGQIGSEFLPLSGIFASSRTQSSGSFCVKGGIFCCHFCFAGLTLKGSHGFGMLGMKVGVLSFPSPFLGGMRCQRIILKRRKLLRNGNSLWIGPPRRDLGVPLCLGHTRPQWGSLRTW